MKASVLGALEERKQRLAGMDSLLWVQTAHSLQHPIVLLDLFWAMQLGVPLVNLLPSFGGFRFEDGARLLSTLPAGLPAPALQLLLAVLQQQGVPFADFKRTHSDNWSAHRERLTPEQQDLITDMLPTSSFYA